MQIVSGPIGRERVHYEAPPANRVSPMMADFLDWFGRSRDKENGLVRAALAHLWFETIHPFVDGNGRVGRAVADMALAQDERTPDRFYSLSAQIAKDTNTYYDALQSAQHGSLDVTAWVRWFVETLVKAIGRPEEPLTAHDRPCSSGKRTVASPLTPGSDKCSGGFSTTSRAISTCANTSPFPRLRVQRHSAISQSSLKTASSNLPVKEKLRTIS